MRYAKRLSRAKLARELKREATLDEARQIYREYESEGVPGRVLALRHGKSMTTIYRRIDDARWDRRRYEQEVTG